tara:strand:+ start:413 stop:547 length:135 start_codon:yes stop_codon:yes gene_type:complete
MDMIRVNTTRQDKNIKRNTTEQNPKTKYKIKIFLIIIFSFSCLS